ncbi:hypothetical protein EV175_003121 [Coemansia sp. RSA 1933]|nr:hypothetical protein EV175_003121 [Coemansia sp. RSA 1933]
MSSETTPPPIPSPSDKHTEDNDNKLSSETLKTGDPITESLLVRLAKLEKYEHKLGEVARVYRNLNTARKAIEAVLKKHTPVQSIADVEELEAHLSNLNMKAQYAGEQIGALTELDKNNRAKISDLETQVSKHQAGEAEKQRELDAVARERKVAEGQFERSNQKLKLDISLLETKLAEADNNSKKQEEEKIPVDAESLAYRLTELISDKDNEGLGAKSEKMNGLYKSMLGRWGIPEGLVSEGELDTANRALESCQNEVVQLKDIMRKELDSSEERLKQLAEDRDKEISGLNEQLKVAGAQKDIGLSSERVTEIVSAAVAGKLVGSKPATNATNATNATATGGAKKKGNNSNNKKKRRGTTNNTPSPSPSLPAKSASDDTTDSALEISKSEIAQLVSLIESAGTKSDGSSEKVSKEAANALDIQLAEARKAMDEAQSEAKKKNDQLELLRADISQLQTDLGLAESQRDKLAREKDEEAKSRKQLLDDAEKESKIASGQLEARSKEIGELKEQLSAKTKEIDGLKEQLGAKTAEVEELKQRLDANKADLADSQAKLDAAEKAAGEHSEERSRLAQSLAKAQGANARLESKQRELQTQMDRLFSERDEQRKRGDDMQRTLERLDAEHSKALAAIEAKGADLLDSEQQRAKVQATVAGLEEHVRAVDADLASSRAQFAEKSRLLAQTATQLQEAQYALEKERRASKSAADALGKELEAAQGRLAEEEKKRADMSASSKDEIGRLQRQLGDLDQRAKQATQVERLEAQQAEKVAELEALRSNMQRTEEAVTGLQVEVDRLRDIERDFDKAREQLERVGEERRLSEQRWKRVHRDLKDEVRRLNREKQVMALATQQQTDAMSPSSASSPVAPSSPTMPRQELQSASMSGRSNSLTLGSVSTLLRAATGNSGNGGGTGRQRPIPSSGLANGGSAEFGATVSEGGGRRSRSSRISAASSSMDSMGMDDAGSLRHHQRHRSEVVNVEYLRNVLFRFFNDKERRTQLVPVLSMLLDCKAEEIKGIQLLLQ